MWLDAVQARDIQMWLDAVQASVYLRLLCFLLLSQQDTMCSFFSKLTIGKTRLLYSWLLGVSSLVDTIPTESFNVEPVQTPDGINLLVWDISGDPSYRTKRRQFFHGTEGIVYVIDTSDPALMQEAKEDLVTILRDRDLLKVPLLLIANTRSSQGALDDYRLKKELNLKSVLRERRWDTVTIAAFDQKEVDTSIEKLQNLLKSTCIA